MSAPITTNEEFMRFADEIVMVAEPRRARPVLHAVAMHRFVGERPTVAGLAKETGMSEDLVRKHVTGLLETGYLSWTRASGLHIAIPGWSV